MATIPPQNPNSENQADASQSAELNDQIVKVELTSENAPEIAAISTTTIHKIPSALNPSAANIKERIERIHSFDDLMNVGKYLFSVMIDHPTTTALISITNQHKETFRNNLLADLEADIKKMYEEKPTPESQQQFLEELKPEIQSLADAPSKLPMFSVELNTANLALLQRISQAIQLTFTRNHLDPNDMTNRIEQLEKLFEETNHSENPSTFLAKLSSRVEVLSKIFTAENGHAPAQLIKKFQDYSDEEIEKIAKLESHGCLKGNGSDIVYEHELISQLNPDFLINLQKLKDLGTDIHIPDGSLLSLQDKISEKTFQRATIILAGSNVIVVEFTLTDLEEVTEDVSDEVLKTVNLVVRSYNSSYCPKLSSEITDCSKLQPQGLKALMKIAENCDFQLGENKENLNNLSDQGLANYIFLLKHEKNDFPTYGGLFRPKLIDFLNKISPQGLNNWLITKEHDHDLQPNNISSSQIEDLNLSTSETVAKAISIKDILKNRHFDLQISLKLAQCQLSAEELTAQFEKLAEIYKKKKAERGIISIYDQSKKDISNWIIFTNEKKVIFQELYNSGALGRQYKYLNEMFSKEEEHQPEQFIKTVIENYVDTSFFNLLKPEGLRAFKLIAKEAQQYGSDLGAYNPEVFNQVGLLSDEVIQTRLPYCPLFNRREALPEVFQMPAEKYTFLEKIYAALKKHAEKPETNFHFTGDEKKYFSITLANELNNEAEVQIALNIFEQNLFDRHFDANILAKLIKGPLCQEKFEYALFLKRHNVNINTNILLHPDFEKLLQMPNLNVLKEYLSSKSAPPPLFHSVELTISLLKHVGDSVERIDRFLKAFEKIESSPIHDVKILKQQILSQVLEHPHPEAAITEIENVFERNNLPIFGKILRIFQILYPSERIKNSMRLETSPVLRHNSDPRNLNAIFYGDLLKIHSSSGNRSLRNYLNILAEGEKVLQKQESGEKLSRAEKDTLRITVNKLDTLAHYHQKAHHQGQTPRWQEQLVRIRANLNVPAGQTIIEKVGEIFLKPLGVKNITEALEKLKSEKPAADQRNRQLLEQEGSKTIEEEKEVLILPVKNGDLTKGVDAQYLPNILENGSVSKEFLGSETQSDSTPFDIDLCLTDITDWQSTLSINKGYGEIILVMRDRHQWQITDNVNYQPPDRSKYELFRTGVVGSSHYGIRTGIASTEISFIIATDSLISETVRLNKKFYEIARNGFYIPVVDERGKVIFTPEKYDQLRHIFDGIEELDGNDLEIKLSQAGERYNEQINELTNNLETDQVKHYSDMVKLGISIALQGNKIGVRTPIDDNNLNADLSDIGSTGRNTNLDDSFDFDFSCKLIEPHFTKFDEIKATLVKVFLPERQEFYERDGYKQLRFYGATVEGKKVDIDIGFTSKKSLETFDSHDAISGKLNWIKKEKGLESYNQVIANIKLAKKKLKSAGIYKKGYQGEGGLGGIGVETWILNNQGNFQEALRTFHESAHDSGTRINFQDFIQKYKILGAGENLQRAGVENFTHNMTEEGYQKMLNFIEVELK